MANATTTLTALLDDIVDVRDLIDRFESLESLHDNDDEKEEFGTLKEILAAIKGLGGDEKWRGDWYPVTLIHERYFTTYTQELLEDTGIIPTNLPDWVAIDWERTAEAVQEDYTPIEIAGHTYWTR